MGALRDLLGVVGAFGVLATSLSVLRALVVPGSRNGLLTGGADRGVELLMRALIRMFGKSPGSAHRFRALQGPFQLLVLLWLWFGCYLVSYAFLIWSQAGNFAGAFRESGSSLVTLGIASTRTAGGSSIDILAGITGLVIVALQIAYLPTLYSAYSRREIEVSLVSLRAGRPPWGPELLARTAVSSSSGELPAFYLQWERLSVDVAESHASYPILMRFQSLDPGDSFILSLLAVMDSAALLHSARPAHTPIEARLCIRTGIGCLRTLARTRGIHYDEDPSPDGPIQLSWEEFEMGLERLHTSGFTLERTEADTWRHFRGWRVNYEAIAYRLAYDLDVAPVAWSGPRRRTSATPAPRRTINRTPDDPEGVLALPMWDTPVTGAPATE